METGKESEKEVQKTENREQEKFEFKHDIAMFHSSALRKLKERAGLLSDIGSFRRALCSRRDLEIRRQLCKVDKVSIFFGLSLECCFMSQSTAMVMSG